VVINGGLNVTELLDGLPDDIEPTPQIPVKKTTRVRGEGETKREKKPKPVPHKEMPQENPKLAQLEAALADLKNQFEAFIKNIPTPVITPVLESSSQPHFDRWQYVLLDSALRTYLSAYKNQRHREKTDQDCREMEALRAILAPFLPEKPKHPQEG
jgi:hypothetical protein